MDFGRRVQHYVFKSSCKDGSNLSNHPELRCCVEAVETRDFWRPPEFSPNHRQDYHFYHNAETHYLVGKAMGIGMNKATKDRPGFDNGNIAGERFQNNATSSKGVMLG